MIERFNLRAYGILVRNRKVLISSEQYEGHHLVKFPGGGVEYGEGIRDALVREWKEEANCPIEIGALLYVTDYFVQSAFREEDQIVSFYYEVYTDQDFEDLETEHKIFWLALDDPDFAGFTFPQEDKVFQILKDRLL